jgi:hypothetical protein
MYLELHLPAVLTEDLKFVETIAAAHCLVAFQRTS